MMLKRVGVYVNSYPNKSGNVFSIRLNLVSEPCSQLRFHRVLSVTVPGSPARLELHNCSILTSSTRLVVLQHVLRGVIVVRSQLS